MEYLFLILAIIAFLIADQLMKNIAWIGALIIIVFLVSIVKRFKDYRDFGFDFGELMILLLKLGGIAFVIFLMLQ